MSEEICFLQQVAVVLLPLIFSFGTTRDHAILKSVTKYFCEMIDLYYDEMLTYDHTVHSQRSLSVAMSDQLIIWLAKHLKNVTKLIINNEISEDQLKVLLQNKTKMKHLDISPYHTHYKITFGIFSFIMDKNYCPNLKYINSIGCNIDIFNNEEYEKYVSILKNIQNKHKDLMIQRLPSWFAGDAIIYRYNENNANYNIHENAMPTGEIHSYQLNGMYNYSRNFQNNGIVTAIHYIDSDPLHNAIRVSLWLEGWEIDLWGIPSFISKPWNIPKNVIDQIENDQDVLNAVKQLNMENVLETNKYHWSGDMTVQMDNDQPLLNWPDTVDHINMFLTYSIQLITDK